MNIKERLDHKITHFLGFLGGGGGHSTARMASSKTFLRPFCVNAEHSRYLTALISFAICKLCGYDMGVMFFWRSFSIVSGSSRKSSFVPTRIIGFSGAWWLISGYHYHARWLLNTTDHGSCLWISSYYLCFDVFKRRRAHEWEADKKDIRLRIGERSQSIVVLLPSCVPQAQIDRLSIHLDIGRVVVEANFIIRDMLSSPGSYWLFSLSALTLLAHIHQERHLWCMKSRDMSFRPHYWCMTHVNSPCCRKHDGRQAKKRLPVPDYHTLDSLHTLLLILVIHFEWLVAGWKLGEGCW